jgi:hypothetical protein
MFNVQRVMAVLRRAGFCPGWPGNTCLQHHCFMTSKQQDQNTKRSKLYLFTIYSLNKPIGLDMTTTPSESSGTVAVLRVLTNPVLSFQQLIPSSQTVHEAVENLWRTIGECVDNDFTSETTKPLATVVLSGEIGPFTQFKVLICFHQSHS